MKQIINGVAVEVGPGADLAYANLEDANLSHQNLANASFYAANLRHANLRRANLYGADLHAANLEGANLEGANLDHYKYDVWAILSYVPNEVRELRDVLREGRIDGTCYGGECACLVGTLAELHHVAYTELPGIVPDESRPAERWFMNIHPGDTPETNTFARLADAWITEWLALRFGLAALGADD